MDKVKMIRKDAVIKIDVGTTFIERLNLLLLHLTKDISQDQLEKYKEESSKYSETKKFSEPWMEAFFTVSILLIDIQKQAEKQGHTYEKNSDDFLKDFEESIKESLPPDQSPEQPE